MPGILCHTVSKLAKIISVVMIAIQVLEAQVSVSGWCLRFSNYAQG